MIVDDKAVGLVLKSDICKYIEKEQFPTLVDWLNIWLRPYMSMFDLSILEEVGQSI